MLLDFPGQITENSLRAVQHSYQPAAPPLIIAVNIE